MPPPLALGAAVEAVVRVARRGLALTEELRDRLLIRVAEEAAEQTEARRVLTAA